MKKCENGNCYKYNEGTLHDAIRLYFGSNSSFPICVILFFYGNRSIHTDTHTYVHVHCF